MTMLGSYFADLNAALVLAPSIDDDQRRRIRVVYGDKGEGGQGWTPLERLQAVDAVKVDGHTATLMAEDLPDGHPLNPIRGPHAVGPAPHRRGRYPVHMHMMGMGQGEEQGGRLWFPHAPRGDASDGEIKGCATQWSDAGVSEDAPIDPAAWRGLSGTVGHLFQPTDKRALTEIKCNEYQRPVVRRLRDDSADALTYLFQPTAEQVERAKREQDAFYEQTQWQRDALRQLAGAIEPSRFEADMAWAWQREERRAAKYEREMQVETAKPVLLVPEGCVLVIPDDVNPHEFMAAYDTTQMGKTAVIVNRKGYAALGKVAAQQEVRAVEAKRTHAALTFEQPIQSRLGRMAK